MCFAASAAADSAAPFGGQWMMCQFIEDVPAEEMAWRAATLFSQ